MQLLNSDLSSEYGQSKEKEYIKVLRITIDLRIDYKNSDMRFRNPKCQLNALSINSTIIRKLWANMEESACVGTGVNSAKY